MPRQGKRKSKKDPPLPKWNLKKNDQLKQTYDILQRYNAPKKGIPGWVYHYNSGGKASSTRQAWGKLRSMQGRGEIKRLPYHLYLYGGDVTQDRKRGMRWKTINLLQKIGVPRNEAIYGVKTNAALEKYREAHPEYVSPFPAKYLLPRLRREPIK